MKIVKIWDMKAFFRINRLLLLTAGLFAGHAGADVFDQWSDPTRPYTAPAESDRSGLRLQYTMVSPQRRVAVINGRRYETGARVDGWEIVAIDATEVVLRDGAKEKRLRLVQGSGFKRPPTIVEAKRHDAAP